MELVTGGLGFVGSHLVEALLTDGFEVMVLDRHHSPESNLTEMRRHPQAGRLRVLLGDVRDLDSVSEAVRSASPDTIYHLAALASHRLSIDSPQPYLDTNIRGVLNVLEAARRAEPSPKVVFSSSSSVYGDHPPPLREDMEPRPKGPYAVSKFVGEQLCAHYHDLYRLPCVVLRYFNVIGPRCRANIVLNIFAERLLAGEPPEVYGRYVGGEFVPATRDFTYVGDIVDGTLLAGRRLDGFHIINLGAGRPASVLELAHLVIKAMRPNSETKTVLKELRPHEALHSYSDATKARELLGWQPKTTLKESVRRYVEWLGAATS